MNQDAQVTSGQLIHLLERAATARVLVVGDVMVDDYLVGVVERTSPEAPVPVLRVRDRSSNLGGAANVARQLAAFGAQVSLAGAIGDDATGARFEELCAEAGVDITHVSVVPGRPTTRKQRAVQGGLQVLRIDWEDTSEHHVAVADSLLARLAEEPPPDVVVVSDYAKGYVTAELVQGLVDLTRTWGVPLLVDPKSPDFTRYRGATLVKANRVELEAAIGRRLGDVPEADLVDPVRMIQKDARLEHVVVTLGERGMVVLSGDDEPVVLRQSVEEAFDVSGAGDTVLAVLALGMVSGQTVTAAAAVANEAAGVVVRKTGVAICQPGELASRMTPIAEHAPVEEEALAALVSAWRREGRRVVFTNGCFDLLHAGHLHLLRGAAAHGDVLVVALNSDRSVSRLKGPGRPFISERERVAMLAALSFVDAVVVFDDPDPGRLVALVQPDVLVKGSDYGLDEIVGRADVEARGGTVVTVPILPGWSTTSLLDRIAACETHA